jgi:hypothetical protein
MRPTGGFGLTFLVLVLLAPLTSTDAQQLSEVAPGARVRIRAPGVVAGRYTGTVLSRTADTIAIASSGASSVRVPVASLTSVEVSRGKSRSRGAIKGAAWGAGIGLIFGVLTTGISDDVGYGSEGEYLAANLVGGAFWGALIGAIAGSERWDRYDLPARSSLVLPVTPGRFGVGVRLEVGR